MFTVASVMRYDLILAVLCSINAHAGIAVPFMP